MTFGQKVHFGPLVHKLRVFRRLLRVLTKQRLLRSFHQTKNDADQILFIRRDERG